MKECLLYVHAERRWMPLKSDTVTKDYVKDASVFACMDNYHARLIAPAQMPDEEIMKFQSSLREVMLFIKYSKDKENLSRVLAVNEAFPESRA